MLLVYVRESLLPLLHEPELGRWVTRSNTLSGIKGALALRFRYEGLVHCLVASHLEANTELYSVRLQEYKRLTTETGFETSKTVKILDAEYRQLVFPPHFCN